LIASRGSATLPHRNPYRVYNIFALNVTRRSLIQYRVALLSATEETSLRTRCAVVWMPVILFVSDESFGEPGDFLMRNSVQYLSYTSNSRADLINKSRVFNALPLPYPACPACSNNVDAIRAQRAILSSSRFLRVSSKSLTVALFCPLLSFRSVYFSFEFRAFAFLPSPSPDVP